MKSLIWIAMLEQHKCHTVLFRNVHCYGTWTAVGSKVATPSPAPQGNQRMCCLVTEESPLRVKNHQWVWLRDWVEGVYWRARLHSAVYPYFYCIGEIFNWLLYNFYIKYLWQQNLIICMIILYLCLEYQINVPHHIEVHTNQWKFCPKQ